MSDARDTLLRLATVDRCVAVWCAAQCSRAVLHLVPAGEDRPRLAVEVAEAWAREPTEERGAAAYAASASANAAAYAAYATATTTAAAAVAAAATAASAAAYAAYASANAAANAAPAATAAYASANAAAYAIRASARTADLSRLDALVRAERWPLAQPTLAQILAAPDTLAVAWDMVATLEGDISVEQFLVAHAWAQEQRLDWAHPVARAVAERVVVSDEDLADLWRAA